MHSELGALRGTKYHTATKHNLYSNGKDDAVGYEG
jgi:hypothetical protein